MTYATLFVGIDLGNEHHWLTVLGPDGSKLVDEKVEHSPEALLGMVEKLLGLCGTAGHVRVALESPHGPVVDLLMDRGFQVLFINPKQLDRFRDRHSVAGAKDDRLDAFVLAQSLMTDGPCFHAVTTTEPKVLQLRELLKCRDDMKADCRRVTNRLREQLLRYHSALIALNPAADEPWLWKLWELHKRPSEKAPTVGKVRSVLKEYRIRRIAAEEVHARLMGGRFTVADGVEDSAVEHIQMLIPQARLLDEQISRIEKRISGILDEIEQSRPSGGPSEPPAKTSTLPTDVKNLRTFYGGGDIVVSSLICFGGRQLAERDYDALRTYSGVAPVTVRSGKMKRVHMRQACNPELRNALHALAQTQMRQDARSRELYASHRQKGHSHGRALRAVADRCLRIIVAMLRDCMPYDPGRADEMVIAA